MTSHKLVETIMNTEFSFQSKFAKEKKKTEIQMEEMFSCKNNVSNLLKVFLNMTAKRVYSLKMIKNIHKVFLKKKRK